MGRLVALIVIAISVLAQSSAAFAFSQKEELGKLIFHDTDLSTPPGQACGSCHVRETGWTNPNEEDNEAGAVHEGAVAGRFGSRKPPSIAYAAESPVMSVTGTTVRGGVFWDGRATGLSLGDPLADLARMPFLDPLEQNNSGAGEVVEKVRRAEYAKLFESVWGAGSLDDTATAYDRIAFSVAAYVASKQVSPRNSRYDVFLRTGKGLTKQELRGLALFETPRAQGGGGCNGCHPNRPAPDGSSPNLSAFGYANIGIPKNPQNPFYTQPASTNPSGTDFIDLGVGRFLASTAGGSPDFSAAADPNLGKVKMPTLRNVDKRPRRDFVKAYGHNGFFKSLEEIVHFYNTRDVPGAGPRPGETWPQPEFPATKTGAIGNLGLTASQEADIVAFLKTLSDR